MKKTRITSKFKLITPKDKKKIRGGCYFSNGNGNGNGNNGGIPPYQPGGQGDNDKDDD